MAITLLAVIFMISSLLDAPLRERANPAFSPNPAKAPWYFMGLQELLIHFHPLFAVFIMPVTVLAAAAGMPYVKSNDNNQGVWFLSRKGISSAKMTAIAGIIMTMIFIALSELLPDPEALLPKVPAVITTGLIPFLLAVVTMWLFLRFLRRHYSLNRPEIIQSVVVMMVVSYAMLTVTGIFFRGEGMNLVWPWNI